MFDQRDQLAISTLRFLAIDGVEKANSGHPGLPMGAAAMAWVLWKNHLRFNPDVPQWTGRDRFILSAGHGSMLLYGLLHLFGYDISLEDLKNFRQWGSITAGHPEYEPEKGIETTTGPLGQGFANGVGMAIAAKYLQANFTAGDYSPFASTIYSICGDGDLQEGVAAEAASLAGHLKLGNIVYLYDDNHITIDGPTDMSFSEDVGLRFEAYGWHIIRIDGNDLEAVDDALTKAKAETERPSLIMARTNIGYGSPNKQDKSSAHGSPLGPDEVRLTKEKAGWPLEPGFHIPNEIPAFIAQVLERKKNAYGLWQKDNEAFRAADQKLSDLMDAMLEGKIPEGLDKIMPKFGPEDKPATRAVSGKVINAIAPQMPSLVGGSADLSPSNNTLIKESTDFSATDYTGRNIRFGVREHAMGSVVNGMAQYGGVVPYCGTFLVFSDYMRPAIRLAALMRLKVIYVFTHDSIGLGEDGPTHQPVEHLAALRAIPGLRVIRPADANETTAAWQSAISYNGPTALILTRQGLGTLTTPEQAAGLHQGAYIIRDTKTTPDMIVLASGSEVGLAVAAAKEAENEDIRCRVISIPSFEIFAEQPEDYHRRMIPGEISAIGVEAGIDMGWEKFGIDRENSVFMESFGASAPAGVLFEKFGFSVENLLSKIRKAVK